MTMLSTEIPSDAATPGVDVGASGRVSTVGPTTERKTLPPTRSWEDPESHFTSAIESPWYRLIFRMMADFCYATHDFYRGRGFLPALMPVTCNSVSSPMGLGSDSLPVKVKLFDEHTYLADSMQFHLEYLLRQDAEGVFYVMPTFRGEDPDKRHLNQFFHSEAEIRGDLTAVMKVVGEYVTHCTASLLQNMGGQLRQHVGTVEHLEELVALDGKFATVSFTEARKILGNDPRFYSQPHPGVISISREGERELMKRVGRIVWLTHLPANSVPFYQALAPDGESAMCADLLFGIGEVVGCGERHVGETDTLRALVAHKVDPSEYDWYLRMKREYPMQTAGFGLGLERFLLWALRHDDIRDIHLISRLKGIESTP